MIYAPFSRCPYCDYRGTSSSLLIHHKRGRHKAELEMEMLEKERQSIKVSDGDKDIQPADIGWPTGNGKKLRCSQAQLGQATCLGAA